MKTQVSAIRSAAALDRPAPRKLPTRKILWEIQDEGGTAQPLIFVLAGHGDAWVALGLARALGPEHTVYGVQPPGEGAGKLNARELAATYVAHLRAVQSDLLLHVTRRDDVGAATELLVTAQRFRGTPDADLVVAGARGQCVAE